MITGIQPQVAQAIAVLGVDLHDIVVHADLKAGVAHGLRPRHG